MTSSDHDSLTRALREASRPAPDVAPSERQSQLLELVYGQLRAIAERRMAKERNAHTLQATALVNEAYCKLVGDRELVWEDQRQFYLAASQAMRRVLLDHSRRRAALKRAAGKREPITLSSIQPNQEYDPHVVVALDEAIERLAVEDERAAAVVKLRYFGGLEVAEVAKVLEVSDRTVLREWAFARARLAQWMSRGEP